MVSLYRRMFWDFQTATWAQKCSSYIIKTQPLSFLLCKVECQLVSVQGALALENNQFIAVMIKISSVMTHQ